MGGLGKTCTPSVCGYYIRNTKKDFFPNLPFLLFPTVALFPYLFLFFCVIILCGLGDSLVLFSIFFALLLVLWILKYIPKRRRIPRPMFYELYKSSELSSADGDGERGKSAEN